jgi:hypothetical protein
LIDKKKAEKKFAQKLAQMKKVNLRKHLIFVMMFGVECVYDICKRARDKSRNGRNPGNHAGDLLRRKIDASIRIDRKSVTSFI